nr:MAG TPA: hypothetical protein [Caudoviricetes sp.]
MYAHVCVWRCCKFCKFASLPSVFPSFLVFRLLYNVRARVCVEMLQVLQVCKFAFRFSVFSCFSSAVKNDYTDLLPFNWKG